MTLDLRGEMTSLHAPTFSHPVSSTTNLSISQAAFASLGWAIKRGDEEAVVGMLDADGDAGTAGIIGDSDYVRRLPFPPSPPSKT